MSTTYETVISRSTSSEDLNSRSEEEEKEELDLAAKSRKIEKLKKRMAEMEAEAAAIRHLTNNLEMEMETQQQQQQQQQQTPATIAAMLTSREEADSRSVFVGNVDYACTPEEVQQHFHACGIVNRVTIPTNSYGQPQGYAYIEFVDIDAVEQALRLNASELHGRQLKVALKRTNIPGNSSGFRRAGYRGARFRRAVHYMPY